MYGSGISSCLLYTVIYITVIGSMTGVGGRPEVVVMGSNDKQKWKEYEFLYKPGSLNRSPPVVGKILTRLYLCM